MSLTLDKLFQVLAYNELSSLALSSEGKGTILQEDQPKIIGALNDTLQRLNNQFVLSRADFRLLLNKDTVEYLPLEGQSIAHGNLDGYIDDTDGEPLRPIVQILSIRNPAGLQMPINDQAVPGAIKALPNVIRLQPKPLLNIGISWLKVDYRPTIEEFDLQENDLEKEINIPATLVGALRAGIASVIFMGMTGQEHTLLGQHYEARYQARCQEIALADGISNVEARETGKFEDRGWV